MKSNKIKYKVNNFYKKRNLWKTISWRTISLILSFIIGFLITGSLEAGGVFAIFDFLIKSIIYYAHERYWNNYTIKRIRNIKQKRKKRK
jgi:uncharacterized membrane protein